LGKPHNKSPRPAERRKSELSVWAEFGELINSCNRESLVRLVAAIYFWNGEAPAFARPHLVIQLIAKYHRAESSEPARMSVALQTVRLARLVEFANLLKLSQQVAEKRGVRADAEWETHTLRHWSSIITNPGTVGEMLSYLLDKFRPFDSTLHERLGFTSTEACRTILTIYFGLDDAFHSYVDRKTAFIRRRFGPEKHSKSLLTPPADFLRTWASVSRFPPDLWAHGRAPLLNRRVIDFLTTDIANLSPRGLSFGRWAFMREADGASSLLVPEMLTETLVSAIHFALFQDIDEERAGNLGRKLGRQFEELVAAKIRQNWPSVTVRERVIVDGVEGDTDLVVDVPGGKSLLIQCKGKPLRPVGRWGGILTFEDDLRRTIGEAGKQASASVRAFGGAERVGSVLIVVDAYFPGLLQTARGGLKDLSLWDQLPGLLVLTHYDLSYLTRRLSPEDLPRYLSWREELLTDGQTKVFDEYDLIRAYLKWRRTGFLGDSPGRAPDQYIGYDREFEKETLQQVGERLAKGD